MGNSGGLMTRPVLQMVPVRGYAGPYSGEVLTEHCGIYHHKNKT